MKNKWVREKEKMNKCDDQAHKNKKELIRKN